MTKRQLQRTRSFLFGLDRSLFCLVVMFASSALPAVVQAQSLSDTTSFSSLSEINATNIAGLTLSSGFVTGIAGGQGGAPQANGDAIFFESPFPNVIFALDVSRKPPRVKWTFAPRPDGRAQGLSCCGRADFGPALAGGILYANTLDGRTFALDAESGGLIWQARLADPAKGETLATPPLLAEGKVFIGNAGGEYGARGWIAALDAKSGQTIWQKFATGPDAEVGIGAGFAPFYGRDRGADLGVTSWPPSGWMQGGGTTPARLLYDAELRLLFDETGRAAPWNAEQRPGENRWTSGLFARDADTGEARWFVSFGAGDPYGRGGAAQDVLIDGFWAGTSRKLLLHPDGNGYLYVIDRGNGEILAADAFAETDAAPGIQTRGSVLRTRETRAPEDNVVLRAICPAWSGATGEGAAAYSPKSGLLYIPVSRLCMDFEPRHANYLPGTPFIGANIKMRPPKDGPSGALVAWDVQGRRASWSVPESFPLAGSVLATAGDLVVYGTLDGMIKARDSRDGRLLWSFQAGNGIISQPTTFNSADGHQYLAVLSGLGGSFGMPQRNGLDPLDQTAGLGLATVLAELPKPKERSATLHLFRLP